MRVLWSVRWFADAAGFQVCVCNRCRVVVNFQAESLSGEQLADIRQQAAAKAVELALERRVPLDCVAESSERYGR